MTQKEIHDNLDEMLSNPKSKNFLNHLIRAYFPISNVDKVWEKPKNQFKCVLTKDELFSAQDILEGIQTEEFKKDFIDNLKSIFSEDSKSEHPIVKLVGDKKMGVTGKETNTYMSYSAMQEFYNWVSIKCLNGDKHINWLLNIIKKEDYMKNKEKEIQPKVEKNNQNVKKEEPKTGTFTLGELDSFKKLLEKFNK
jgi:hypothetical protein